MKFLDYKELSQIINIALATSKIEEIKTPYKKIRPFMHLLMYGQVGSGKSTILWETADKIKQTPYMGLTKSHLSGSVDKTTGLLNTPAPWDSRNNALMIDEFSLGLHDFSGRDALNSLLSLMENPTYTKKIGYRCNDFKEKDKDLYCIVNNNQISVKTRFVLFLNTMMNVFSSKLPEIQALKTRCIPIPYYPSLEDLHNKLKGEPAYTYKKLIAPKKVTISKKNYDKILYFINLQKIDVKSYLRTFGDLCRTCAVIGYDEKVFKLICDLVSNKRQK